MGPTRAPHPPLLLLTPGNSYSSSPRNCQFTVHSCRINEPFFPSLLTEELPRTRLGKLGTPSHTGCARWKWFQSYTHPAHLRQLNLELAGFEAFGPFCKVLNSPLYIQHTFFHLSSLFNQHSWVGTCGQRCLPQILMTQVRSLTLTLGTPAYTK